MVNYYDKILASIGILLLGGAVTALLISPMAVMGFAVIAGGLIGHAMFMNPPIDVPEGDALSESAPVPTSD